jgi:hypothetical protein
MNRLAMCATAAAGLALFAHPVAAQSKTVQGEAKTMTVTVEAIEQSSRELTVKRPDGTYDIFYIPATIKRFETLKIGDKINARYYENMVLQLKPPGEAAKNSGSMGVVKAEGGKPAVTSSRQRTITATIAAIDPAVPSITFTGPNGWKYSGRVEDKAALAKVKVGDRLDITWTEALLLSIEEPKK